MTIADACIAHINIAPGFRGGERQTELLMRYLANAGWRQLLAARQGEELATRCADIPGLDINEVSGGIISAACAFDDASLIHVHQGRALKPTWLQSVFSAKPYIVTRRVQKGPRHNFINRSAYGRAARIIAVSGAIRTSLHQLDAGLDVQVIPDSSSELRINQQRTAALRVELNISDNSFVVGHVGALVDSHKGQSQIIEMARMCLKTDPQVAFVLVGGGADEAMFRREAKGLSNLHFAGHVDNVGDYLNLMDLFLYPSRHEGLGSVLLDALAFGLPIVATQVGGIPEIVEDGVNGFLFEPNDTRSMLDSVLRIRDDMQLSAAMSVANRRKADGYSPARMGKRYELIYQSILGIMP